MTEIGPVAQQGVISTQMARVQNDAPTAASEPPQEAVADATQTPPPPPPPPAETGRGTVVDTTA